MLLYLGLLAILEEEGGEGPSYMIEKNREKRELVGRRVENKQGWRVKFFAIVLSWILTFKIYFND